MVPRWSCSPKDGKRTAGAMRRKNDRGRTGHFFRVIRISFGARPRRRKDFLICCENLRESEGDNMWHMKGMKSMEAIKSSSHFGLFRLQGSRLEWDPRTISMPQFRFKSQSDAFRIATFQQAQSRQTRQELRLVSSWQFIVESVLKLEDGLWHLARTKNLWLYNRTEGVERMEWVWYLLAHASNVTVAHAVFGEPVFMAAQLCWGMQSSILYRTL